MKKPKLSFLLKNLLAGFFLSIFASCEYSYNYSYTVHNNADSTVTIHLITYKSDSVYNILSDSTKLIYINDHGTEGSKGPYFKNVSSDLQTITVMKGNASSDRDYKSNGTWQFTKTGAVGSYSTTISNNEF